MDTRQSSYEFRPTDTLLVAHSQVVEDDPSPSWSPLGCLPQSCLTQQRHLYQTLFYPSAVHRSIKVELGEVIPSKFGGGAPMLEVFVIDESG